MRVAVIHARLGRGAGLEGYASMLLRGLAGRGHEVHVIASRVGAGGGIGGVRVHRVGRIAWSTLDLLWFDRASARVAGRLGVDATIGLGRTTRQDLHRAGGGCHRVYSRMLPPWKRLGLKNRVELLLERRLYLGGGTRHFVVNAAPVARQLEEEYGLAPGRVSVVRTPVDGARFRPATSGEERAALRREFGLGEGEPVFLFVSMEHRRKGLGPLLEAWRGVRARLVVAGVPLRGEDRGAIARWGLEGRVTALDRGDLDSLYRAADWLVHPTLYDACANTVLEALSSGLPPIVSARDGASELVEDGDAGFLLARPEDPASIRGAVDRALATGAAGRGRMCAAARGAVAGLTVEAHLDGWERLMRRWGCGTGEKG